MKSLKKNSILNVIYNLISLIFPIIISSYVSRILLPEGVGKVAYAQNIASYFIMFASLGIPTYGIKKIAEVRESQADVNKLFTELFVLNFVFTLISSILYIILIYSLPYFRADVVLYWACGVQVYFMCLNIDWLYSGNEEYLYIVCRSLAVKILSIIALFAFVKVKEDYVTYALITSVAMVGNYVFNMINSRKYAHFNFSNLNFRSHISPIFSFAFLAILNTTYNKIDITMIGLILDEKAVGYYSNAHKIINIVIATCTAFTTALLPRLSYYFSKDRDKALSLVSKGVNVLSFIVMPSVVGIMLVAPQIVDILFGTEFLRSSVVIRIFAPVIFIRSFGDLFCWQLLVASGNEKMRLKASVVATIINIGLNALLIPVLYENGAVIASIASELFINAFIFVKLNRMFHFSIDMKTFYKTIFCSLLMVTGIIPSLFITVSSVVQLLLTISICSLIYLVANICLKNEFLFDIYLKIKRR